MVTKEEALAYHADGRAGKLEVVPTVPFTSQKDLSLAYSPGVAHACVAIEQNAQDAYAYTAKKNLVAVMSNGTAVLGLGNIGALASKPVMEGKAILFKKFSDIDAFDIEIDKTDVDGFCEVAKAIAPTFGGINLEDIKAPECFEIEDRLVKELDIPVMHDDQHGTAIISTAGMMNACEITGRKIEELKVVIVGAGASAIASANMYKAMGVENIIMSDSKGVIHKGRTDLNKYKQAFAIDEALTLDEAFVGAHMLLALSVPGSVTQAQVASMSDRPIVFTLSNPTPEIFPDEVRAVKPNAMIGTGRSDFDNQINNVLGFPFIFRGAIDVKAKSVTMDMKIAAARALAQLAKEEVPEYVNEIFGKELSFGKEYIIPKPFDKRLIVEVSAAVAQSAFETGVAQIQNLT